MKPHRQMSANTLEEYIRHGSELTAGAGADYGYDFQLYRLAGYADPTPEQIERLNCAYKKIFDTHGAKALHDALIAQKIRKLLDSTNPSEADSFKWVVFLNEPSSSHPGSNNWGPQGHYGPQWGSCYTGD